MSEKERLQLENECLMKYSKAQMIQKYIDELEENYKLSELWCDSGAKIGKLENQQKEFMEYINEKIDICDGFIDTIRSDLENISYGGRIAGKTYIANEIMKNEVAKKTSEEILSKYQEIIGGKE